MKKSNKNINNEWISFADLMTILLIIFVMISASYGIQKHKTVQEIQILQNEIYEALNNEFKDDLDKWSAQIDPQDATVSFTGYNLVQFKQGSSEIEDKFQSVLDDFFPRYVSVIKKFDRDIRRLRIEGHTSSEWGRFESEDDRYLNNLDLSQRRAFNVLKYCLNTLWFPEKKWIKKKLGSEGLSSSQLIKDNFGYEDKKRSRRTVFKIDIKHGDYYLNNSQNNLYTKLEDIQ